MEAIICASKPSLFLSKPSPWKPRIPVLHPTPAHKLNRPLSTYRPHANAKGFASTPSTVGKDSRSKKSNKNNDDDDDEIPQAVFQRIIVRILVSVGLPMATGLALLNVFGLIKEQHLWDVPQWLPFLTTFITFGASTLGIAYGTLSTSWDEEKKGSFLGLEEAQKNWIEMWKEEDESQRQ
ncbi:protein PAM68, chloroplastic [Quillaja saponaria]|uniref:Protein PAM68, chloroplastic n=1 Tax=Quillaja saponaria TaxID=32244 RepID=A0AAD7Q3D9_QUISA|nr:protein PAM68, chloroplastic [Quillaja saponaria]